MKLHECEPTIFRARFAKVFEDILESEELGSNIEIGVFNFTIREAAFKQIIKKWKNPQFCEIYSSRMRSVLHNVKNYIRPQILSGQINTEQLAYMTHQEMCPEKWKEKLEKKMKIDLSHFSSNIEASTDMFTCKKCKSKRCTYYEMQTRSADEPATIFITCLDCGKGWRN